MLGILKQLPWVCASVELDPSGRYIILNGSLGSRVLTVVGVYCPNTGQSTFWDILTNRLFNFGGHGLIILGDFNTVLNKELDRSVTSTVEAPKTLHVLIKVWDLVDVWREKNLNRCDLTYFFHRPQLYSRIECILLSGIFEY